MKRPHQLCEDCGELAPIADLTREPHAFRFRHTDRDACDASGSRAVSKASHQSLPAMSPTERRAHAVLAEELGVSPETLALWVARATAAARLLDGTTCGTRHVPAADRPLAEVVDLDAYRSRHARHAGATR